MEKTVQAIREDFPILDREVNGNKLVYLDNAATTLTPRQVTEAQSEYYDQYNANVHRGIHELSHQASVAYERAHDRLAEFVGASGGREEIIFTKNTTECINLVAYGFGLKVLDDDDVIITTEMEHHASIVTWQQIAQKTGAELKHIRVKDDGHLDIEHAKELIDDDVAIVSLAHVSNMLGTINPVETIAELAHDHDAYVLIDGAQSVSTRPIDVESMDIDFFAFSGHKMLGPTGIGCLYAKKHLLEQMDPFLFGGGMIQHVTKTRSSWTDLPWKFEAGTPPIAEGIALAEAAAYLEDLGMETVRKHENELAQYALMRFSARDDVEVYGPPPGEERAGLVSFNVDGVHGHDLSSLLNDRGIAVRAGDHCTQPLHEKIGIPGSVRTSFYVYNTESEIDTFCSALDDTDERLAKYLASDRYHDRIYDHYRRPRNAGTISNPTITKSSNETSCGDRGVFHVEIGPDGTVEKLSFESESCAVSSAVASMLTIHLQGKSVEEVAKLDGDVAELLEGQFPEIRRDCVEGPEKVIREAAREFVDGKTTLKSD